jgi:hypothetical protein
MKLVIDLLALNLSSLVLKMIPELSLVVLKFMLIALE